LLQQQGESDEAWSPVVVLQPTGTKRPFFCVHPGTGDAYGYLNLAHHLGTDRPIYGFQARGLIGDHEPHESVESMAACYVEALRQVQPEGPYFLGGHSSGGLVAFEMAQILHQQGQEVGLLAIIDTFPWYKHRRKPSASELEARMKDNVRLIEIMVDILERFWQRNLAVSSDELRQLNQQEQLNYLARKMEQAGLMSEDTALSIVAGSLRVLRAGEVAYRSYIPHSVYPGRISYFCCDEMVREYSSAWDEFTSQPVKLYHVPGEHISMLIDPNVSALATQLKSLLDHAEQALR
jgi:thioesterase domain-containing protein